MTKIKAFLPYALVVLLILVLLWNTREGKVSTERLHEIEKSRKALADSLEQINDRFEAREARLKAAIKEDLELIDHLNLELTLAKKNSESIRSRISNRKKKIEELWNAD